jgi:hypothetical protein
MTTPTCTRCHSAPVIAIGLCRRCGLRLAEAERTRLHRQERRQQAQDRRTQPAAALLLTVESEDAA